MSYLIGTSGWQYKDWRGTFYPEDLPTKDWLGYYASLFDSVEVNSTFYHMPRATTAKSWHDGTPDNFMFVIKLNRYLTHTKRLTGNDDFNRTLNDFYDRIRPLGPKLAAVLVQLPPGLKQSDGRLDNLAHQSAEYDKANGIRLRLAIEFRHASWFTDETYALMRRYNLANVISDSPDRWPASKEVTADFAYIRFHGNRELYRSSYTDKELAGWAGFIRKKCAACQDVLAYFNNDYNAVGARNALTLVSALK